MSPEAFPHRRASLSLRPWLRLVLACLALAPGTALSVASSLPLDLKPTPLELGQRRFAQELAQDQATEILLLQKSRDLALSASPATPAFPVRQVVTNHSLTYFVCTDGSLWRAAHLSATPTYFPYSSSISGQPKRRSLSHVKIDDAISSVALSALFSLTLKTDGTATVAATALTPRWNTSDPSLPTSVSDVQAIAAGDYHRLLLKTDGTVLAQGQNTSGQLGDGSTTASSTPTQVLTGVRHVFAAANHSFFLKDDGSVWAAGDNTFGQLGDGTTTTRATPVPVLSDVLSVATARTHTLFLKTDGSVWVTGYTLDSQTDAGLPAPQLSPVHLCDDATAIAAGVSGADPEIKPGFSLILKTDRSVWRAGHFAFYDAAELQVSENATPVRILDDIAAVHAGEGFCYYIRPDGNVLAEGKDRSSNGLGRGLAFFHQGSASALPAPAQITAHPHTLVLARDPAIAAADPDTPHPYVSISCRSDAIATDMPLPTLSVVDGPGFLSPAPVASDLTTGYWRLHLTGNGTVTVRATHAGTFHYAAAPTVDTTIVADLLPQAIRFPPPPPRTTIDPAFTLSATSSAGLPVSFSILSGPASLDPDGQTVTLGSTSGLVTVRATQPGGTIDGVLYAPAAPVEHSFEVTQILPTTTQDITFTPPSTATFGDSLELDATASSGLPVTVEILSGPATLNGATLTFTGAGKVVLRATQPGTHPYKPASPVNRTLTVAKKNLVVASPAFARLVRTANPADFGLTYSGFVGTDTAADLDRAPIASTTATPSSPAGTYPITLRGGADDNYTFTPGDLGPLTVLGFGGAYEALLVDDDLTPLGKVELTIPANGLTYTGILTLAAEAHSITLRGSFAPNEALNSASATFTRTTDGVTSLALTFNVFADGTLSGSLERNGDSFAHLDSGRLLFVPAKGQSAPWSGAHTLALYPLSVLFPENEGPIPGGSGHATATLDSKGILKLSGKLADGSALTASLKPASAATPADGVSYRVFTKPYGQRLDSFLAGRLALQPHPETGRFPTPRFYLPAESGSFLVWKKAASPAKPLDKSYRAGFGPLAVPVTLDPWLPPSAGSPASFTLAFGPADLDLGASADLLPTSLTVSAKGTFTVAAPVTVPLNATKFSLKLTPNTGAFSGSFTLSDVRPPATKPTVRPVSFSGTLRQPLEGDTTLGTGFFLLPDFDKSAERPSAELTLSR